MRLALLKQAFAAGGLKGQFQADNVVKMIDDLDKEKLTSNTLQTDLSLVINRVTGQPLGPPSLRSLRCRRAACAAVSGLLLPPACRSAAPHKPLASVAGLPADCWALA